MSGDSSLGIGIGLALKSYGRAFTYVKIGRVLDLTTPFSELTFTLEDKSGEGNDATLYSGRYISTDGSTDRGIVADCSAAGAGSYYLTGKVRPNAVTTAELTMDGSTDSGLTGLTADVWQTFTTATSAVTPSAVQVGYDGSTASAADWSDVKLIDASDDSVVARWQLNESADGDLNGYPALDSSGNGYHGTHVGCAGGTGEAGILQTAGMDWNKYYYPDASWDSIGSAGFSYNVSFTENSLNGFVGNTSSNFGLCMLDLDADVLTGDTVSIVLKVNSFTGATPTIKLDATQAPSAGAVVSNIVDLSVGIQTINLVATGTAKSIRVTQNTSPSTIDVDWFMITTSNGGTAMLSPASDATPTNDALGNAIAEPRPTADTWNLFGDGEYGQVADADSLDLTTEATWEMWLNPYGDFGTDKAFFAKTEGSPQVSWLIYQNDTDLNSELSIITSANGSTLSLAIAEGITDEMSHVVVVFSAGVLTVYQNAVTKTVSGAVAASLFTSTSPVIIGTNPVNAYAERKISRPKIYNRALTADEVLQNYNAQKGAFGL